MKPAPFTYHDPGTVAEVVALLRSHDNVRVLAGGQSLLPMMNMRYAQPDHIVDIGKVQGLSYIRDAGETLEIGAMTRQRDIEFSPLVAERYPVLREAVLHVGHRQTRNRGTIGGSLCHLDPAAELPLIAALYDAAIVVEGTNGKREMPFSDFAQGFMTPALEPDEMLTGIVFPLWRKAGHGFVEFARRHGDFAMASAAAMIVADSQGRIARAAVAIGGVSSVPVKMRTMEESLVGQPLSPEVFAHAATACEDLDILDDVHAPASYRKTLAAVAARRALAAAAEQCRKMDP